MFFGSPCIPGTLLEVWSCWLFRGRYNHNCQFWRNMRSVLQDFYPRASHLTYFFFFFFSWLSKHLSTHSIGSYSFQNAFFYLQWPDDESISSAGGLESHLVSITKTKRKVKLHPHKQRSKYIIRPEYVVEVGNHFVWEFIPGHGSLNVPQSTGNFALILVPILL